MAAEATQVTSQVSSTILTVAYAEARSREKVEQARADEVAAMARAEAETRIFELQTMHVEGAECGFGNAQAGSELNI